ncbi:MAG: deoxyribonuclease IV [Candidatus Beckwithbacteria bacterium]
MRRIGAHVSTSGGISQAIIRLVAMGGNCLQIFSSSPRMWLGKLPEPKEVDKFNESRERYKIGPVFIHAKYLINLASPNMELVEKSYQSLKFDLKVGELIKAEGVIVHLGSHKGRGFTAVKDQLVQTISKLLQDRSARCKLLIENSAGQQGKVCSLFEEISLLIRSINSKRLGWCYDTCHGYNAGYLLGKGSGNTLIGFDMVEKAEKLNLLKELTCLHVNDSRDKFNSGHDRHANLGEGQMGLELLQLYVNQPKLDHLPLIIETPGFDNQGPDKKNLKILKGLVK